MNIEQASSGFAAVGAVPRLSVLLKLVRVGPKGMAVGELQNALDIPASTLAHHLRYLQEAELIDQKKVGRQVLNVANFKRLKQLADFFLEQCCAESEDDAQCCDAFGL